mgnify:CR=1 FL=1
MTENEINDLWKDPKNWRIFFIYYCKDDPRIIVSKRVKSMGWTLNFANPWAFPTIILVALCVLAPFRILYLRDVPLKLPLWLLTIALTLISLILFCSFMASARRYAKKTNKSQTPE